MVALSTSSFAGNKDRAGQAGANQLLINPWARSSGWAGANSASVTGLEATYTNIAGLAFTPKTEIMFANTSWFAGSGINVQSFGLSQRVGETGVLGLSVQNMNFGDIGITTEDLPEGGIGTFAPKLTTINLGYAKEFSNSIYGGLGVKVISEGISNAKASGIAFDMGAIYKVGLFHDMTIGFSIRNFGGDMKYSGENLQKTIKLSENIFEEEDVRIEVTSENYSLPISFDLGSSLTIPIRTNDQLIPSIAIHNIIPSKLCK